MKITLAQLNPIVGDISGNVKKIENVLQFGKKTQSDVVVFPELFLTGYPLRDLLNHAWFIEACQKAIVDITQLSVKYSEPALVIGVPFKDKKNNLFNSALFFHQGKLLGFQHKTLLPAYDVFDETRYFTSADTSKIIEFKGEKIGLSICEDAWNDPELWPQHHYEVNPIELLVQEGATVLLNISASPFHIAKQELRMRIMRNHAKNHRVPYFFVNQVGGNDELIFDGRSCAYDKNGEIIRVLPAFEESMLTLESEGTDSPRSYKLDEPIKLVHDALVLGIHDYMRKCGFSTAVIGLSGGIDSAVTCSLACRALGNKNVTGVTMPGPYSSAGSIDDSKKLAENLGIDFKKISIKDLNAAYNVLLNKHFTGKEKDITLQNIQARIRGNILMAFSNQLGALLLTTGNKSELAVGYCTIYGDMCGGLAVISDVPKTMVYQLARYINNTEQVIPQETITKQPSAELKENQVDQDTLPSYDILDAILELYISDGLSQDEIVRKGFDPKTVGWVMRTVDRNEYKRRQAAAGLKVTSKAFGMGRRMPVAARFEHYSG